MELLYISTNEKCGGRYFSRAMMDCVLTNDIERKNKHNDFVKTKVFSSIEKTKGIISSYNIQEVDVTVMDVYSSDDEDINTTVSKNNFELECNKMKLFQYFEQTVDQINTVIIKEMINYSSCLPLI